MECLQDNNNRCAKLKNAGVNDNIFIKACKKILKLEFSKIDKNIVNEFKKISDYLFNHKNNGIIYKYVQTTDRNHSGRLGFVFTHKNLFKATTSLINNKQDPRTISNIITFLKYIKDNNLLA